MPTPLLRNARLACVLLIAALAGTGCSDQNAPAGAEDEASVSSPVEVRKGSRTPSISYLHVEGNTLFISNSVATIYVDVTLTNPGPRTPGLSLQGLVQQGTNGVLMNSALVRCSTSEGTLPHGTCTMTVVLTSPDGGLAAGSALFTLRLLKEGVPGQIASQSVTVNVFRS
jgi:hypothetical protein